MTTEQIALYLRKGAWATLCYRNQFGEQLKRLPEKPTVHLRPVPDGMVGEMPAIEYATMNQLLDRWRPVFQIHFTTAKAVEIIGERATELWKAWCALVYGDNKPKKKKRK